MPPYIDYMDNAASRKRRDRGHSVEWADDDRSRKRRDRGDRLVYEDRIHDTVKSRTMPP